MSWTKLFPLVWASGQVAWSWVALGTDVASTVSLFGAYDEEKLYELESPKWDKKYTRKECDERLNAFFSKKAHSWGVIALLLLILSPLAQAALAAFLHRRTGQRWQAALLSLFQLDEVIQVSTNPAGDRATRLVLASNDVVQAIFGNLQALLSLYTVLAYTSDSFYVVPGCGYGYAHEIMLDMWSQFLKVAAAIVGSAHGLMFVSHYTRFSLLSITRIPGWRAPEGWRSTVNWLKYDLLTELCLCCSVATHIMVYSILGAWGGGWVVFTLLGCKFVWGLLLGAVREGGWSWHVLWQAGVSTTATLPWGTWQKTDGDTSHAADDGAAGDPKPQQAALPAPVAPPSRAWWVFMISVVADCLMELVVATCIVDDRIVKDDGRGNDYDYDWPQGQKEAGWSLLGLVLVQLLLWPAVCWVTTRRVRTYEAQQGEEAGAVAAPEGNGDAGKVV